MSLAEPLASDCALLNEVMLVGPHFRLSLPCSQDLIY